MLKLKLFKPCSLHKKSINFATMKLSTANTFSLDKNKILLSSTGMTVFYTAVAFH